MKKSPSDKNPYLLTVPQLKRLAAKARKALAIAECEAGSVGGELGCKVAEHFVEGAIESAAEALAILARIKISLRIARRATEGGAS